MSSFFHLSKNPNAKAIVASSDQRAQRPEIFFSPRQPRDHFNEKPDPRICVAPKVWQCLVSTPEPETPLFIYSLRCSGAIWAGNDECNVEDADITHEHWIIDDVITQNGGDIALTCEGILTETHRSRLLIQDWVQSQKIASRDHDSVNELEHLWIIDEATNPKIWRLRLCWSQKLSEESPLLLPRMWP